MKRVHFHAKMQRLHDLSDMTIGSVHLNKKQIWLLLYLDFSKKREREIRCNSDSSSKGRCDSTRFWTIWSSPIVLSINSIWVECGWNPSLPCPHLLLLALFVFSWWHKLHKLSLRFDGHTVYAVLITFISFLKQFYSDGYISKCYWFSGGDEMLTEFWRENSLVLIISDSLSLNFNSCDPFQVRLEYLWILWVCQSIVEKVNLSRQFVQQPTTVVSSFPVNGVGRRPTTSSTWLPTNQVAISLSMLPSVEPLFWITI
jgi:hypothetical protein